MAAPAGVARGGRRGHAHPHAVSAAAEAWDADGRPEDDLFRGGRLQTALDWRDAAPRDLTTIESRVPRRVGGPRHPAERSSSRARAQRDRRQNRRLRVLLGVAAGLIVLLVGAGSVAVVSSQEANAQRDSATIEALVATSLALRTSERDVSALLAAEAYRRWPDDPRTRSGLMSVLQGAGGFLGTTVLASSGNAYGSLIPGTEDVLVVTTAGDAGIRDAGTGDVLRELDLGFDPGPVRSRPLVEVSGDGRVGAVLWSADTQSGSQPASRVSTRSDLVVFDLERAERIGGPTRIDVGTGALAVNADGSIIAVADSRNGAVTLVSTSDWQMRGIAEETPGGDSLSRPSAAALAFDGRGRLLVGRLGDRMDVIDPASATISASMAVPEWSAHVRHGGRRLRNRDRVGRLRADRLRTRRAAGALVDGDQPANPGACEWLAMSESMQRVYCGNRLGRIDVFDLADGAPIPGEEIGPLYGDVGTIDVSGDGATLTVISGSRPIISRWHLEGMGLGRRLVARGHMLAGPYSYEGSSVATAPQVDAPVGVRSSSDGSSRVSSRVSSSWTRRPAV